VQRGDLTSPFLFLIENMNKIDTIIFDLGGVLIDWNPRYMYKKVFESEEKMEHFLQNICTMEWNEEQDAGRSFAEATSYLVNKYPEFKREIEAYYTRWEEMLNGPILETVNILQELVDSKKFKIVALTNWSAESFPIALEKYYFLHWFDGILVSGKEKMKKPDPKIFHLLFERYQISPQRAIFIDDNPANIKTAQNLGLKTIHFLDSADCKVQLDNFLKQ